MLMTMMSREGCLHSKRDQLRCPLRSPDEYGAYLYNYDNVRTCLCCVGTSIWYSNDEGGWTAQLGCPPTQVSICCTKYSSSPSKDKCTNHHTTLCRHNGTVQKVSRWPIKELMCFQQLTRRHIADGVPSRRQDTSLPARCAPSCVQSRCKLRAVTSLYTSFPVDKRHNIRLFCCIINNDSLAKTFVFQTAAVQ